MQLEALEQRQLLTATVIAVDTPADTVDPLDELTSLREAILAANASPEDNEIQLPAGTYTLTRQGANEDAALTGDLDVLNNGSLKIVGTSAETTVIDASGLFDAGLGYGDHIFDIKGNAVAVIEGLTLTGGSTGTGSAFLSGGGAIYNAGDLNVTSSNLSGNSTGSSGGAIWNRGALTVTDSTFSGNTANDGGAIWSRVLEGAVAISGSTFIGNSATMDGGAIHSLIGFGQLAISDSAFSNNEAGFGGGAIHNSRDSVGQVNISNSTLTGNTAGGAGAIAHGGGQMTITGSTISGNTANVGSGGGITSESSGFGLPESLTIVSSTLSHNSAVRDGGAIRTTGTTTIIDSTLSGNTAEFGGGLAADSSLASGGSEDILFSIVRSTISDNIATGRGAGGIFNNGRMNISDSTISGNHADGDGGGIVNWLEVLGLERLTITNSTISGNSASSGGGIKNYWLMTIENSTIVENLALNGGGGVFDASGFTIPDVLNNTIIAGNSSNGNGGDWAGKPIDPASSFNLIGDPASAGGLTHGANGNIVGDGLGNPLDVSTVLDTTLANNGGPTLTHALVLSSPAVNSGDPLFDPNATDPRLLYDQRGAGYARVFGGRVDIGAFEFGSTFETVVAGRHIFYDNSFFDGNTAGANPADALAIATDKQPLLPGGGLASAANATSYSRGINGTMIDIAGSHPEITLADFVFRVGNNNAPGSWSLAPEPATISVLAGQGLAGADRVVLTWPSGSIINTWLEVQVLANANTGLAVADVFYWGNKIGDSFTSPGAATFNTTTTDSLQVFASLGSLKPVTDLRDYNRDGQVTTADSMLVFANLGSIVRLSIPAAAPLAAEPLAVTARSERGVPNTLDAVTAALAVPSPRADASTPRSERIAQLATGPSLRAAEVDKALSDEWAYLDPNHGPSVDDVDNDADELALLLAGDKA